MKEKLMTAKEISDQIKYEDECGVNTLLQNLIYFDKYHIETNVYFKINEKNEICG